MIAKTFALQPLMYLFLLQQGNHCWLLINFTRIFFVVYFLQHLQVDILNAQRQVPHIITHFALLAAEKTPTTL